MTLRQKQSRFPHLVALLILHAEHQGYEITFAEAYRDPRCPHGLKNGLHPKRLAIDLNLFRAGRYLRSTKAHQPLGEYWESIGGTWGGRFSDGNHYSLEHGGMK
jgi:hypothetical protein